MNATLNIGLVAYQLDDAMVFVRVPNERGRWVLTERCVVEVDCPHCASVSGEPCQSAGAYWRRLMRGTEDGTKLRTGRYTSGIHAARRRDYFLLRQVKNSHAPKPKIRLSAADLEDMRTEPVELAPVEGADIDVVVTMKELPR